MSAIVTAANPLPTGRRYGVIYADPPWSFKTWSAKGTGRSAASHYDCIDLASIAALPVAKLAADDCALFLWLTDPSLECRIELIRAWGFTYKTVGFTWVKPNRVGPGYFMGTGYYTRANPEQCLLATRGKPTVLARDVRQLVHSPRREHSRKPDEVRHGIERLFAGPYIELFARETTPGWHSWGNEVGLFDNGPVETRRQPSCRSRGELL